MKSVFKIWTPVIVPMEYIVYFYVNLVNTKTFFVKKQTKHKQEWNKNAYTWNLGKSRENYGFILKLDDSFIDFKNSW